MAEVYKLYMCELCDPTLFYNGREIFHSHLETEEHKQAVKDSTPPTLVPAPVVIRTPFLCSVCDASHYYETENQLLAHFSGSSHQKAMQLIAPGWIEEVEVRCIILHLDIGQRVNSLFALLQSLSNFTRAVVRNVHLHRVPGSGGETLLVVWFNDTDLTREILWRLRRSNFWNSYHPVLNKELRDFARDWASLISTDSILLPVLDEGPLPLELSPIGRDTLKPEKLPKWRRKSKVTRRSANFKCHKRLFNFERRRPAPRRLESLDETWTTPLPSASDYTDDELRLAEKTFMETGIKGKPTFYDKDESYHPNPNQGGIDKPTTIHLQDLQPFSSSIYQHICKVEFVDEKLVHQLPCTNRTCPMHQQND